MLSCQYTNNCVKPKELMQIIWLKREQQHQQSFVFIKYYVLIITSFQLIAILFLFCFIHVYAQNMSRFCHEIYVCNFLITFSCPPITCCHFLETSQNAYFPLICNISLPIRLPSNTSSAIENGIALNKEQM